MMAKEGSTLSGVMDGFATSISMALQYGVPLNVLVKKFAHMRFEPSGMTSNKQIPFAKSIMDYIFRWLASKFLSAEEQKEVGILQVEEEPVPRTEAEIASLVKALTFITGGIPRYAVIMMDVLSNPTIASTGSERVSLNIFRNRAIKKYSSVFSNRHLGLRLFVRPSIPMCENI